MQRNRIFGWIAVVGLCAVASSARGAPMRLLVPCTNVLAGTNVSTDRPIDRQTDGADRPASKRESPVSTSDLEREYSELDKAYQASRRAAADEIEARRKAGEKTDDGAAKSVESEYWPRFEELAAKGSGHARLWMALELQIAFKSRARALNQKETLKLLDEVVAKSADEPWISELAKSFTALYIMLPEEEVDRLVDAFAAASHKKDAVAEALYRSASFGKSSKRPGAAVRAEEISKRLQTEFADTEYARKSRGEVARVVGLGVGNVAPEFTTKDADGVEFKLSDYRGKVVVLDFWGFW
jgi:AhpC/TSA family